MEAMNAPVAVGALLLFVALFVGLAVRTVIRELARMREELGTETERDYHVLAVPELGMTMADGGEPEAKKGE